jgi:hypothetical protein
MVCSKYIYLNIILDLTLHIRCQHMNWGHLQDAHLNLRQASTSWLVQDSAANIGSKLQSYAHI